jgi:hypothetical protein
MRLLHVLLCCAERTCRRGDVMQAGSLRPRLKIKRVVDHLSEVRLLGAVSALMARGMDWRRFRSDGLDQLSQVGAVLVLVSDSNITAVMWPIWDMPHDGLAPLRWRSVSGRARCRHPRCPQRVLQHAAERPAGRSLPIQAEHFGEQIEAAEYGTCHVAGCHHLLPPVVQRRQQLETGVAGKRLRVDRQPWLALPGEDVVVVQVPVQQAVPGSLINSVTADAQIRTSR